MKTVTNVMMTLVVVLSIFSCSSLTTSADYDQEIDFSSYKTYSYKSADLNRLQMNELDKNRLITAVDAQMQAKGFRFVKDNENPNLWVNLVLTTKNQVDVETYNYGYGMSPYWSRRYYRTPINYQTVVSEYKVGTLLIDFIDNQSSTLIWEGKGTGYNMTNTKNKEERINKGVAEILAQYPPKRKTSGSKTH